METSLDYIYNKVSKIIACLKQIFIIVLHIYANWLINNLKYPVVDHLYWRVAFHTTSDLYPTNPDFTVYEWNGLDNHFIESELFKQKNSTYIINNCICNCTV